jgi:superfamily II DNA or RNA helicase
MTTTRYLIIDKVNEVYLKIEAEADIRRELGEYFTFEVPGYKFMPAYQNRVWDGKIRLFSYATGKIYAGLYLYIKNWCKENNIHVVDGTKIKEKTVDDGKIDELIKALKLPYEVRDYQREAFKYSVEKDRCLLVSPTASGKSLIIYLMLIYNLLRLKDTKQDKILVIVPTTSLVEQLFKDFKDYGYNSERNVHRIYSGHEKETNKRVIISTDEAHLFKAVSLTKLMTKLEKTKYRVGLTGTLDGSKTHKLVLEGLFGAVNKVVSTSELIEKGKLAQLKIMCLVLQHDQTARHFLKDKTYQEEMDYLVSNEKRNKYIRNLATSLNGNTLCLFQYVEKHGKNLYESIRERATDKQVFYVHGGVDTEQREKIREITEGSDNAIIVASYGTFSTGINIRNLHNIIFASPSKSRIRNLQSIGRGLRLKDDNGTATLYDLSDDISYNGKENYTLQHFKERINIYNGEDFNYEIHNVELTNGSKNGKTTN